MERRIASTGCPAISAMNALLIPTGISRRYRNSSPIPSSNSEAPALIRTMNPQERFSQLVQTFFCDYLFKQRDVSPETIRAYRDTFRLLLDFFRNSGGKRPEQLTLEDLNASNLLAFLHHLREVRGNCTRTVNCRLAALRCFFHYTGARLGPDAIAQVQRIMAIPFKRFTRPLLGILSEHEIRTILKISTVIP